MVTVVLIQWLVVVPMLLIMVKKRIYQLHGIWLDYAGVRFHGVIVMMVTVTVVVVTTMMVMRRCRRYR